VFTTIASPADLARHLDDPAWVVVDCRHTLQDFAAGRAAYQNAHVPGAFFAGVEDDLAGEKTGSNGRHPLPDPRVFAAFLASMGVNDDTQIVAYDAGADMFAARMWFLTKWIGHDAVAVLDGGFSAWQAAGYPVTSQLPAHVQRGNISPILRPDMNVDAEFVAEIAGSVDATLLDARSVDRFEGRNETVDPVAGHIPGARNRFFKENFDERGRLKSPQRLRAEFEALGVPPERIVHQCGSGVSAAVNALAMDRAGLTGWRLYPGSWSEWCADPRRPVATGAAE
jgi:thiosulfate/3-mercaptopyruvate sulfurtransferase